MAMNDDERAAFVALMALTAEECLALADVNDKIYIAKALADMSDQMKGLAASMVQSHAAELGKTPEEVCPCPDCRRLQKTNATTNN